MTGHIGLFRGTRGDLEYHFNKQERAELGEIRKQRAELLNPIQPKLKLLDEQEQQLFKNVRKRVYGD